MEPKKITLKSLQTIVEDLISGKEDSRGTYLYKGFRLQISKYKASGAERTSRLYHKRREQGLCIRCGVKVTTKNPKSGKLYRLCDDHRNIIDRKTEGTAGGRKKKVKKTAAKKAGRPAAKSTRKKTGRAAKKSVGRPKK